MSLQPIRHRPYCPIEFWNIHDSTLSALATTNYATESTNFQFKVILFLLTIFKTYSDSTFIA